jgi:hypothetical protein
MVRGFAGRGQTNGRAVRRGRIAEGTLLFGRLRLANVGQETRVSRAASSIIGSRFFEAELAVDSEADLGGVVVFLVVIFPPADRAKLERRGSFEGFVSAAGAAKADFDGGTHKEMDGENGGGITAALEPRMLRAFKK